MRFTSPSSRQESSSGLDPIVSPARADAGQFSLPLHGLRGVAVIIVLLSHLGNADMWLLPVSHEAIGKAGVWVFFALSSFLLTHGLCRALAREDSLSSSLIRYMIQRVFRIYPLYVAVLFLHFLAGSLSENGVFRHLLLQEGAAELWAIPVEFKYYLVVPLVALAAQYMPRWCVLSALGMLFLLSMAAGSREPDSVFSIELGLLPKAAPFLAGSMLALVRHGDGFRWEGSAGRNEGPARILLTPVAQLALWALLALAAVLYRETTTRDLPISLAPTLSMMMAVASVGLMHAALRPTWTARFLRTRALVFMGEISFSLYLLHMFVIHGLQAWGAFMPAAVQAWLAMALSILLSVMAYRFIEQPGMQAGKYLGNKLDGLVKQRCFR